MAIKNLLIQKGSKETGMDYSFLLPCDQDMMVDELKRVMRSGKPVFRETITGSVVMITKGLLENSLVMFLGDEK